MSSIIWKQHQPLDGRLRAIFGYITEDEQDYLYWYMRNQYTGRGTAVELGLWLGRSSAPMLAGMADNNRRSVREGPLHVYDSFIWDETMASLSNRSRGTSIVPGTDFVAEFLGNVTPWQSRVRLYKGDIANLDYPGADIEFLFIDVMKSWDAARSVVNLFFPHLVPGVSTVVHQDFKHFYEAWIHLLMYRLHDCFEPTYSVADSPSLVFNCTRKITPEQCAYACDFRNYSIREIEESYDYSLACIATSSVEEHSEIEAGRLCAYLHYFSLIEERHRAVGLENRTLRQYAANLFHIPIEFKPERDVLNQGSR